MAEPRIVVVEDHAFTKQLLVKMLNRHFQITCPSFSNADQFTEWLNSHASTVDRTIYILDIILSENPMAKTGLDLANDIADFAQSSANIIILTGCPINEDIRNKIKALKDRGISISLFEKPADAKKLLRHVEIIINKDSITQGAPHATGLSETDS